MTILKDIILKINRKKDIELSSEDLCLQIIKQLYNYRKVSKTELDFVSIKIYNSPNLLENIIFILNNIDNLGLDESIEIIYNKIIKNNKINIIDVFSLDKSYEELYEIILTYKKNDFLDNDFKLLLEKDNVDILLNIIYNNKNNLSNHFINEILHNNINNLYNLIIYTDKNRFSDVFFYYQYINKILSELRLEGKLDYETINLISCKNNYYSDDEYFNSFDKDKKCLYRDLIHKLYYESNDMVIKEIILNYYNESHDFIKSLIYENNNNNKKNFGVINDNIIKTSSNVEIVNSNIKLLFSLFNRYK